MTLCSPWITADDIDCFDTSGVDAGIVSASITTASEILYRLSGSIFPGVCERTVRPCLSTQSGWYAALLPSSAYWPAPDWPSPPYRCRCSSSPASCGCGDVPQVLLGRDDIASIVEVVIDGSVLAASAYRLEDRRWLVRQDGNGWPCCQDLSKPNGESGTWSVEFTYGRVPPQALKSAAVTLAVEFIKGCVGDDSCRIPNRATSVTREGITYALLDPQEFIAEGRTGLYDVDLAIRSFNPGGVQRRARIASPESPMLRGVPS